MTIVENINLWATRFPQDQIPKLLHLILDSWKTFKMLHELKEVPITRKFCAHLRNNKNRSVHIFRIDWESHELDDVGNETGRIDLKFSQGFDEKVYFSIECKRLRVDFPSGFKSLANEYVTDGMFRYFNAQYAQGLDKGGMLGYVMDGNTDKAIKDVHRAIAHRTKRLHMESEDTLRKSFCSSSTQVKETCHNFGPHGRFIIYHIFLPIGISLNHN